MLLERLPRQGDMALCRGSFSMIVTADEICGESYASRGYVPI